MTPGARQEVSADGQARSGGRLAGGILLGMLVGVPLGYLLCYASFLVTMLGLFFFMLFGLVIGAAVYRVWSPLQPMARWKVRLGVALVAFAAWGSSLVWEGITFPVDVGKKAIEQVEKIDTPGKRGMDVRADAERATREYLAERHPPGGIVGYWRWALSEHSIAIPITGAKDPQPIHYSGTGWICVVRVVLSAAAMVVALYAVLIPLSRPPRSDTEEADNAEAAAVGSPHPP